MGKRGCFKSLIEAHCTWFCVAEWSVYLRCGCESPERPGKPSDYCSWGGYSCLTELLLYFIDSEHCMDSFYIRMSKHRKVCV